MDILYPTYTMIPVQLKSDMDSLNSSVTSLQWTKIQKHKNSLQRKLNAWIMVQHLYMPKVSIICTCKSHAQSQQASIIKIYNIKLYLPSALPANITCSTQLQEYAFKLCEAQVFEALEDLHLALQLHMSVHVQVQGLTSLWAESKYTLPEFFQESI